MIDNFNVIEQFMNFKEGTFYKFELLVRNTDGENILFPERVSNTNRNILVKSWYIDNFDYYKKIKHEMITLSNLTGARLYITLDSKDNIKLVQNLIHFYIDTLCAICNNQKPSIKNISKTFASETSKIENSTKGLKTIMFDVDSKDSILVNSITSWIQSKGITPFILQTIKGYHVFCYRKFDITNWQQQIIDNYLSTYRDLDNAQELTHNIVEYVSVKANELGLVYHPMKNFN